MNGKSAALEPMIDVSRLRPDKPLILRDLKWEDYLAIAESLAHRRFRISYSDNEMEILSHSFVHEVWAALLDDLLTVLVAEFDFPMIGLRSTTWTREDLEMAVEPDNCYYLTNAPRILGKTSIDLSVDPPPDLCIELEIGHCSEKKLAIYAAMGVPEVWRCDTEKTTAHQLTADGEYEVTPHSRYFPQMPMNEFVRFINMRDRLFDNQIVEAFRAWVREQIAARWPSSNVDNVDSQDD